MAVRVRRSVWALVTQGDPNNTIDWYRKAVAKLIQQPASVPSSWRYLAAVHGVPAGIPVPPGAGQFWDQCQHQSWFFLPWHRGYLASFEAVIAQTVVELGGPPEWALPYWDYSESLTTNPKARIMPPDFFDRQLPGGAPNALWSTRAQVTNGDFHLDSTVVTLAALNFQNFANNKKGTPSGFGGPVTGFNPGGGDNGALENLPHNRVHTRIGGTNGFMGDPSTAALDPIFWLHHANIDRLWEVWRNQGARFRNPTAPQWLTAVPFDMHDGNGNAFTYTSQDMLDTTQVLHGYRYDNVPVAHEPVVVAAEELEVAMVEEEAPELAGFSQPVTLTGDVTRATISLQPQLMARSFTDDAKPTPQHVYLNLNGITGTGIPGDFKVYIHMPNAPGEPALVGIMTTFGLERASDPDRSHGGRGLNQSFEITHLAQRLGLTNRNVSHLDVTFEREGVGQSEGATPAGLEEFGAIRRRDPSIRVDRVSLYYE